MKSIKSFVAAIAGIGFVKIIIETWAFIWFVLLPLILLGITFAMTKRARRKALIEMNRRMDDIIIIVSPQNDIEVPRVEAIYCKPKQMFKHVQNYSALIDQSANPYGIKVRLFIFQDGEFVNENEEEFKERVQKDVFDSRSARHKELKEKDGGFYLRQRHGITAGSVLSWKTPEYEGPKSRRRYVNGSKSG